MNVDQWLKGSVRNWLTYQGQDETLDWLLAGDIRGGRGMVREGYLAAADLGEYVSALVGLHAARALELRDNRRWTVEARR